MNFDLLRDWVRAEIVYEVESREEDSSGYRVSAHKEREEADRLFYLLKVVNTYEIKWCKANQKEGGKWKRRLKSVQKKIVSRKWGSKLM